MANLLEILSFFRRCTMVLPNIIATGIYDSKVALKNTSVTKNRKTTMFEIELPITEAGISYINSSSTTISRNMIICAKPNQIRHTKLPYKCYYVHMIVDDEQLHNVLINTQDFIFTKKYDYYENLFTRIIKYYSSLSNNEEIILQSLVLELIYAITRDIYTNLNAKKSIKGVFLIENAIKYIKENLTEDLSLETISKKMSLSPVYFHKSFKSATGKTLREYIEEQRIKKAIHLLQTTNYTLTKIAYECGFSSQSYFSYAFKRRMKKTPREYIQESYVKYQL